MSPEEQRIAIAEACGWEIKQIVPGGELLGKWEATRNYDAETNMADGASGSTAKTAMDRAEVPNYPEDLNAMHEAEKVLCDNDLFVYSEELASVVGAWSGQDVGKLNLDLPPFICATAAQRAEAFLKCLNLWKESSHE